MTEDVSITLPGWTKGEWHFSPDYDENDGVFINVETPNTSMGLQSIAEALPEDIFTAHGENRLPDQEILANGRLIASAPDLYEALVRMEKLIILLWKDVNWRNSALQARTIAELNEAPPQARAALNKALGLYDAPTTHRLLAHGDNNLEVEEQ